MKGKLPVLITLTATFALTTPAAAGDQRLTAAKRAAATARLTATAAVQPAAWNQIMGAGDISANPATDNTDDFDTSEILRLAQPASIFTVGDNQYPSGTYENFTDRDGYAGSWGRPKLKAITCAGVGNHEYLDPLPGPAGWIKYFSPNCPHRPDIEYATKTVVINGVTTKVKMPTVYAWRPAPGSGWWAYHLDSQCRHAEETGEDCSRYSPQLQWFRAHMNTHPAKCRVVFWHHPRFGNGAPWGDDQQVYWLYAVAAYQGRASLVISGHSHSYERFTSMTPDGAIDTTGTGPRSFTVGTGGAPLIQFSTPARVGTRVRFADRHGVLRITLGSGTWGTEFDASDGTVRDRVSNVRC